MRDLDVLVASPIGILDAAIPIAAVRAGACGLLDVQFFQEIGAVTSQIQRLQQFTTGGYGIKLAAWNTSLLRQLLDELPDGLSTVLLTAAEPNCWQPWVLRFKSAGVRVLWESVSMEEAAAGLSLEVDGIVLKGNEAGGRVGGETAFVLWQRWCRDHSKRGKAVDCWLHGGIGPGAAAAALVGGATGIVLDSQVLLARESPLNPVGRSAISAMDGSETICVGTWAGESWRLYQRQGDPRLEALKLAEKRLTQSSAGPSGHELSHWREELARNVACFENGPLLVVGQDAALARGLADQYATVGGIIQGLRSEARRRVASARRLGPVSEGSPLCRTLGTRYPILQGPMTRVSDTAPFAAAVADAGALPFLALALLRKAEVEKLLAETKAAIPSRPWGVGVLGFLPPEIRREQIEAVKSASPPFAIIAGGRPDQARELETAGIPTYLHVPSPGLLRMFLKEGARKFIFEGRECGGHVGPRSSFVLWEVMVDLLLAHVQKAGKGDDLSVVFAGGIHDGLSAAMVAALAAPLAEKGVNVGVLMGTAYLFTREAVETGAIVPRFQQEALGCTETVLFETGPGHAIRCIPTPYLSDFNDHRRRLEGEGRSAEEVTRALEMMNIGRLRVASKGLDRSANGEGPSRLVNLDEAQQYERGMYMIGQVAALHSELTTMADLHREVCEGAARRLEATGMGADPQPAPLPPCDVAIIGMSCFYPKATDVRTYWQNILNRVDAVTEVPASHWDWRLYYDPDPRAADKIISKWGGFLGDVPFDPFQYGITPASIPSIEPLQLLLLEAVRHGLSDAGYEKRPFNRERVAAVLGIGGGGSPLAVAYGFRTCLPLLDTVPGVAISGQAILKASEPLLPKWTEDSFPGILPNVAVGRVANRFNFGGPNLAIDAACASSLAAVHACIRELETGTSDLAVAMGADTVQTPYAYMAFSKTHALSKRGRCSPFDASADGIVLAEGVGVVVLKRLADAQRDGDRIYAIIKGVGASSDGKEKGLTAPNTAGQLRALRRAYDQAGFSPSRIELIEAHGTGTVVGDKTEAAALEQILLESDAAPRSCAIGSVKSMIGHAKCAAGLAGLIKTTLALHHKTLPPTLVSTPNPNANFIQGPLYLNTEARPWIHGGAEPRAAGVSAFGFGGTNFHVALEEYRGNFLEPPPPALTDWPLEMFAFRRPTTEAVAEAVAQVAKGLETGRPRLADLSRTLAQACSSDPSHPTLVIVAGTIDELRDRLKLGLEQVKSGEGGHDPRGVYYSARPSADCGRVAFLFPGQGSQYVNMLADLAMNFPEARRVLDGAEAAISGAWDRPLGRWIYPPSGFSPEYEQQCQKDLAATDVAQPALGACGLAMFRVMQSFGVKGDLFAGHSFGEYTALAAAGALSENQLVRLALRRGRIIQESAEGNLGGMAACEADATRVREVLAPLPGVSIANRNGPRQTVISASDEGLAAALAALKAAGVKAQRIAVSCGFHSPLVAPAARVLASELANTTFSMLDAPVYSNTTAESYPRDPDLIAARLAEHLTSPVLFEAQILTMHDAGARIFVEVGPGSVLTGLATRILEGRPHVAVSTDLRGRNGLVQIVHALAQLLVHGVAVTLERLFQGRQARPFDLRGLAQEGCQPPSPSTWLVNSVRNRPIAGPEPRLLGQSPDVASPGGAGEPAPAAVAPPSVRPADTAATTARSTASRLSPPAGVPVASSETSMPKRSPPNELPTSRNGSDSTLPEFLPGEQDEVMLRFQDLMSKFLDTQREVMLNYLGGAVEPALPDPARSMPAPLEARTVLRPFADPIPDHSPSEAPPPVPAPPAPVIAPPASADNGHPEPAPAVEITREWLANELMELVSRRTGYPKEMLDANLDLEADLGIDSIKRVEILGGLAESIGANDTSASSNVELEKLTTVRTIQGILDYLESALRPSSNGQPPRPSLKDSNRQHDTHPRPGENGSPESPVIHRGRIELAALPLASNRSTLIPSGAVLIVDDGRGVGHEISRQLADLGQETIHVRHAATSAPAREKSGWACDLTDGGHVSSLLAELRAGSSGLGGLVHLEALKPGPADERPTDRLRRELVSLFLLCRGLEGDLAAAAERGGALVLAATGLGGTLGFGPDELPAGGFAGQGAILGFLKCLGVEWPGVMVRGVDLSPTEPACELAARLLGELADPNGPFEVGYNGARRVTWRPADGPLEPAQDRAIELDSQSVILITGGARGITAAAALELARRRQPRLVLVGRSPVPAAEEAADTASLSGPGPIKSALIERMRREGRTPAPAAIEAAYQSILRDREIRSNQTAIAAAGSAVEFVSADLRDEAAVQSLLEGIKARYGRLDGVIHGAGIIEDRLVRDKSPESLDRVLAAKADSAFHLVRHLDPSGLKFLLFFSSIAGRYGNRGQADYAAANEVLTKLAHHLNRQWTARVAAVDWGPWSEVGMVADLAPHLAARGVLLIPPAIGSAMLADEIEFGPKSDSEVILAGGADKLIEAPRRRGASPALMEVT